MPLNKKKTVYVYLYVCVYVCLHIYMYVCVYCYIIDHFEYYN